MTLRCKFCGWLMSVQNVALPATFGCLLDNWVYCCPSPILIVPLIEALVLCALQWKTGPAFAKLKKNAIPPLESNQCMGCMPWGGKRATPLWFHGASCYAQTLLLVDTRLSLADTYPPRNADTVLATDWCILIAHQCRGEMWSICFAWSVAFA